MAVSPALHLPFTPTRPLLQQAGPIELSSPFSDFSAPEVALFLRNIYWAGVQQSSIICPEGAAGLGLLPGVLRLARQLQADGMVDAIVRHTLSMDSASAEQLARLITAAEDCQLDEAVQGGMRRKLLDRLEDEPEAAVEAVPHLSRQTLAGLLRQRSLMRDGDNHTQVSWTIDSFSACASQVFSPPFYALGAEWRACIWPTGAKKGIGTHLSVGWSCNGVDVKAAVTIQLHGKSDSAAVIYRGAAKEYTAGSRTCLYKFLSLDALRDPQHGYLQGDELRLSVRVSSA